MNVASLELCRELYEMSGWGKLGAVGDDLPTWWYEMGDSDTISNRWEIGHGTVYRNSVPAYDLGYLLRKLPPCVLNKFASGWYQAEWWSEEQLKAYAKEDTPEDAAAKLSIELFKQGILTKEGRDE